MEILSQIIIAGLVVGSVSFTISMSSIFLGFREWISPKSHFMEKLIHCPWCLAHWVCGLMLLMTTNILVDVSILPGVAGVLFNGLYTLFAIVGVSGLLHYVLLRAYDPAKKIEKMREIDQRKSMKSPNQ
jgi:hypothetical protein